MSEQPHKQRTRTKRASLHEKQDQVRATLSEELREEYGQRNVRVNVGDTVEVMRGDDAGEDGEVTDVDLRDAEVFVEGVTVEAADGEETPRPVESSNLRVTDLDLDDDMRVERLEGDNE
ncbi:MULTISPECIES: 50S ribosomal protein L24 [Halobacterium]|uniref:Large ribosomal subunit protein uL24 n=5 Tax=Halobacterium salinarum TaxID=2242 RepID=RL24_HALSA|nr:MULTISPECIES: 50S ribosomal protein L24 [Halobacterium]Q9HPC3.1 RecName: Full=Large ribosomal subunit protein uL24; AltName: Full=50S ribosomal protein L24 [Halobacterium salinarum NRC-1]AAG19947.1 50S ribosomal protein L24P [Halobacterium salinarum NRC-1]MBB6088953.1 large subunit ribosomal protein L24 [Halobacterium salinarum]MCF2164830.1 50S ribosomal protein L24 [Halobacterium salinarum]MCF2168545.1 50S ribosomal protein L24 [Halobacterium salinarum]MCF2206178.1 50S ribosomal protein L